MSDEIPRKRHRVYKYKAISRPGGADRPKSSVTSAQIPVEVLADRDRRMEALEQRDLTGKLLGDPEPGRRRW
jgi:hypothetical protein